MFYDVALAAAEASMAEDAAQHRFGIGGGGRRDGEIDSHGRRCRARAGTTAMVPLCNTMKQAVTILISINDRAF
ncbi:MAG TPA: hypothetical protein PLV07_01495 [Acidiphilium sp.]|jgi:hypothetical protein|uniref:hypothetical protein n=1 Tax=unclassified Acidiphilium TaxID=2617493 RepID=UPI0025BF130B|nr:MULTISPECIES: hypothetical protein [unclassified Acidiphilium]HQT60747.1 hypothetical protein [Acidiphilium sp.]HQU10227.1 hypothetical protein [Acidiphilium sp.]